MSLQAALTKHFVFAIILIVIFFLSLVALIDISRKYSGEVRGPELYDSINSASYTGPRHNVWADLSVLETRRLLFYLYNEPNDLNLTTPGQFDPFQNFVLSTELLRPNKTQSLHYIDDRTSTEPPRWAHVVIFNGAGTQATLDEYMVGPLPPTKDCEIRPLTFYHNSGKSSSPNLVPDSTSLRDWPHAIADEISDITQNILGSVINSGNRSDPDGLEIGFRDPWIDENGRTVRWCSFQRAGGSSGAQTLLPQGLYVKIDTTGRNSKEWRVLHWFYNNFLYNSTESFRSAWATPGFEVTPRNLDGPWTSIENPSDQETWSQPPLEPVSKSSPGHTYRLNRERQFVSWMGFEFYMAFSAVTGVTLYDVRFKGERILYELGLQEALSHYAGSDPVQGAAKYLDSFWGMGAKMFELVQGSLHFSHYIQTIC